MICGPLPAPALTGMWKKGLPKMEFAKRMELFGVGIFTLLKFFIIIITPLFVLYNTIIERIFTSKSYFDAEAFI